MSGSFNYFSFNRESDWLKGWLVNLEATGDGLAIGYTKKYGVSRVILPRDTGVRDGITDFTVCSHGLIYLLDERANLWIYDYRNEQVELLITEGNGLFSNAATLCVAGNLLCLADPAGEHKITGFSISNGQTRWSVDKWGDLELLPLALAVDGEEQHIYAVVPLDLAGQDDNPEIPAGGRLSILKINKSGQIVASLSDEKFCVQDQVDFRSYQRNIYAVGSSNGMVYVLDSLAAAVYGFAADGSLLVHFQLPATLPSGLGTDNQGGIILGDRRNLEPNLEDDRFITVHNMLGEVSGLVPGYRGRVDKLVIDNKSRLYVWNAESASLTVLELQRRVSGAEHWGGLPRGMCISPAIDSTVTETQWHRLALEVELPENTQLNVSFFTSDNLIFKIKDKHYQLDDYIRDETVPLKEKIEQLASFWSAPAVNPADMLLHGAKGRYLWLKFDFIGDDEYTPVLKKFRAYYPKSSWLRYLPAVYQEDKKSADFLERFLAIFETFYLDLEDKIDNIAGIFDPAQASGAHLEWLAGWLAVTADETWTDEQLKQLVIKAPELYKKRGTKQGIVELLEIFTGEKPFIVEYFNYKKMIEAPELRDLYVKLYGNDPYCFNVLVKEKCVPSPDYRLAVQKLLQNEKPAFTVARLLVLQPWIYMDMHTYLGINSYLSELSLMRLERDSTIPNDAIIIDVDRDRFDLHTGSDRDS